MHPRGCKLPTGQGVAGGPGRSRRLGHGLDVCKTASADTDRLRRLLEQLEGHLRRQGAPIVRHWAPGLREADAAARVAAAVGLRLPAEAQVWFSWHHGIAERSHVVEPHGDEFIPGYELLRIDQCVAAYRKWRAVQDSVAYDVVWDGDWFPLSADVGGRTLAVDCGVPAGEATPVRLADPDDLDRTPAAGSLVEAVAYWVGLFDDGTWAWDPDAGRWARAYQRLDDPRVRIRKLH